MARIPCVDQHGRCSSAYFEEEFLPQFFSRFLSRERLTKAARVTFDLSNLRWGDLLELLAIVGGAWHIQEVLGYRTHFDLPKTIDYQSTLHHLSGAGFYSLLEQLTLETDRFPFNAVDPFTFFRFTNIATIREKEDARQLILRNLHYHYPTLPSVQALSFDKIVNEALENCLEHAYASEVREPAPRILAVRRFGTDYLLRDDRRRSERLSSMSFWLRDLILAGSTSDFLEVAIVDVGVGIRKRIHDELLTHLTQRLSRNPIPAEYGDLAALRFVLSANKTTSSLQREGRGYGLYKLKNHVQAWNGLFLLRSGTARIIYSPAKEKLIEDHSLSFFPGTQVRVLLPIVDRHLNIEYVLGREVEFR